MTIARHYAMVAAEGRQEALKAALARLATAVGRLAGCEGVELSQDLDAPESFIFVERWTSVDAHKAAGSTLGREILGEVMAALAEPPKGRYLEVLPLAGLGG
jgi:quinol monooxygenase YgiN